MKKFITYSLFFVLVISATWCRAEEEAEEDPGKIVILTDENFDTIVDGSKHVLVKFYAPWCGHCKRLAPVWKELADVYAEEDEVVIAKLDATVHTKSAEKYEVKGYPTLSFFPKGSAVGSVGKPFQGGRDLNSFVRFINSNAGTARNVKGEIDTTLGVQDSLQELLAKIPCSGKKEKECAAEMSKKLEDAADEETTKASVKAKDGNYLKYYKTAMKKIATKDGHVEKEVARLEKIAKSASVEAAARINAVARKNILTRLAATIKEQMGKTEEQTKQASKEEKEEL